MSKLPMFLSVAAMATLAACGGRTYEAPVRSATTVQPVAVTAPAVIYPGAGVAVVGQPGVVVVETTPYLRPGFGRVDSIDQVTYPDGSGAGLRRLTLRMDDSSIQIVDTRGPNIGVGERVEITPQRYIRYPVAAGTGASRY